tara:strand:- start:35 stop:589 length:555 start_codon:yes stop_codon:yes gene_type:complete
MLTSQLEIIKQGQLYLNTVSKKDYTSIISPNFISSAGSHMRHIIDHYLAITSSIERELIDYDIRGRGNELELSPKLAIDKLNEISLWIKSLTQERLNQLVTLTTEISLTNKNIQRVQTSIARELVFAGSHAVHHYAMIAQISFAQQSAFQMTTLPKAFGLAPATATFLRQKTNQPANVKQKVCL